MAKMIPGIIQVIGEALPPTHYIRLTRGIMLRGATLFEMRMELLALAVFTLIAMVAAIQRFTKRLD